MQPVRASIAVRAAQPGNLLPNIRRLARASVAGSIQRFLENQRSAPCICWFWLRYQCLSHAVPGRVRYAMLAQCTLLHWRSLNTPHFVAEYSMRESASQRTTRLLIMSAILCLYKIALCGWIATSGSTTLYSAECARSICLMTVKQGIMQRRIVICLASDRCNLTPALLGQYDCPLRCANRCARTNTRRKDNKVIRRA
jgi:hypothetical protein